MGKEEERIFRKSVYNPNSVESNFTLKDNIIFFGRDKVKEAEERFMDMLACGNFGKVYNIEEHVEYFKFLDFKGSNLFISKAEHTICQLKAYARYAIECGIVGKVVEIDKGQIFVIGDYYTYTQILDEIFREMFSGVKENKT